MNRRRNHPNRGDIAPMPSNFWREAVGPGMQVSPSIERIARLRRQVCCR